MQQRRESLKMIKRFVACMMMTVILLLPQIALASPDLSADAIYQAMIAKQADYPEGTPWTNDNGYSWKGGIYSTGYGCAGFAFLLSDAAFEDLPARILDEKTFDDIRPGDVLRVNNDGHSVIVLRKFEDYVEVAEGNYNKSIHWGRQLTKSELNNGLLTYIMTRYPEEHAWTVQSRNGKTVTLVCTDCGKTKQVNIPASGSRAYFSEDGDGYYDKSTLKQQVNDTVWFFLSDSFDLGTVQYEISDASVATFENGETTWNKEDGKILIVGNGTATFTVRSFYAENPILYTASIEVGGIPVLKGKLEILGDLVCGNTLTASFTESNNTGVLNYTWQGFRNGQRVWLGSGETYVIQEEDVGQKIECVVRSSVEQEFVYVSTNDVVKEKPDTNLTLTFKHNCEFDNNIAMHYVIPKSELADYTDLKLVIDKEVYETGVATPTIKQYVLENPTSYEIKNVDYWHFTFPGIAASEMGNSLSATLTCVKDGETYVSQTDVYSVREYAKNRLDNSSDNSYKKVLVDMLNYGAAAQTHFDKNADHLVNENLTAQQQAYGTKLEELEIHSVENTVALQGATPKAAFDGKNVVFDTNVILAYRMTFTGYTEETMKNVKVVFRYDNGKGEKTLVIPYSKFKKSGSAYRVDCDCLTPAEMCCTVNATIYDGDQPISDTLQYSIETYVHNRLEQSDSETYKDLIKKMIAYGKAVDEHF